MSSYDHGPLRTYEITWKSGHVETIQGHQVSFDSHKVSLGYGIALDIQTSLAPKFAIHGEIDGRWRLLLTAPEEDLISIRDVTDREVIPDAEAAPGTGGDS